MLRSILETLKGGLSLRVKLWACCSAIILTFFAVAVLTRTYDLNQARRWPLVEARLLGCNVIKHPGHGGRNGTATYWTIEATWDYEARGYSASWRPSSRNNDIMGPLELNDPIANQELNRRYCSNPQIDQLRISPTDPALAYPNIMVMETANLTDVTIVILLLYSSFSFGLYMFAKFTIWRLSRKSRSFWSPVRQSNLPSLNEKDC